MKSLSVELWGYPGSGKTTVSRWLQNEMGVPVIRVGSIAQSIARNRWRAAVLATDRRLLSSMFPGPDAAARRRLASLWLRQACTVAGRSAPPLLEEGLVHGLWRSLYSDPSAAGKTWWRNFLGSLVGKVIVLDVAPAAALARIKQKEVVRGVNLELVSAPLSGAEWERARYAYATLLGLLKDARGVELSVIDVGNRSVAAIAAEVAHRFEMLVAE